MVGITEAHRGLVVSKMRAVQTRIVPEFAPPVVHLEMANGLQKGLKRDIEQDTLCIGSGLGDDVILLDDGILENHVKLSFGSSVFGDIVIGHAEADGVTIGDETLMAGQTSVSHQLPTQLTIGSASIDLWTKAPASQSSLKKATQFVRDRWWLKWPLLAFASFVFLAIPQSFSGQNRLTVASAVPGVNIVRAVPVVGQPAEVAPVVVPPVDPSVVVARLQDRLSESGLKPFLTVDLADDGSVHVHGALPQNLMSNWRATQLWYDAQNLAPTLVHHVDVSPVLSEFPSIASVKLGADPELTFTNGQRVKIGDTVQDSWVIVGIDKTGIMLERGSETIPLDF
jgi:hypothetical protein